MDQKTLRLNEGPNPAREQNWMSNRYIVYYFRHCCPLPRRSFQSNSILNREMLDTGRMGAIYSVWAGPAGCCPVGRAFSALGAIAGVAVEGQMVWHARHRTQGLPLRHRPRHCRPNAEEVRRVQALRQQDIQAIELAAANPALEACGHWKAALWGTCWIELQ